METEIVKGVCTYNPDFYRKDIREQVMILSDRFNLNPEMAFNYLNNSEGEVNLPYGCHHQDGLYAVISPFGFKEILNWNGDIIFDHDFYSKSLSYLLDHIKEDCNLMNYRSDLLTPSSLVQIERTLDGYKKLSYFQDTSHIWVIEAQLGFFRRGESALTDLHHNEYGFSSIFGGSIHFTHRNFYSKEWSQLSGICIGDRFTLDDSSPQFFSNGELLMYNSVPMQKADPKAGLMTFFV
ncbi:MAG: hypothetical protein WC011_01540 [Candidatus Paceibacterota bacterium]